VRVPDKTGNGNAKVTLSFPDWKEGKVASSTFEIPIVDPDQTTKKTDRPIEKTAGKK
jgi:hypothetical protein